MREAAALLGVAPAGRVLGVDLLTFIRHFPSRLRETHFWLIQALVFTVTAFHYGLEAADIGGPFSSVHHIPVTLYLVPVSYAGIHYSLEGGILTALWVVVLTTPSIAVWHRESFMWLGETAQLLVTVGAGVIVAWRVEREASQRRRAEAVSRRLALLHDVSTAVTQTLDLERALDETLARVAAALESDRAWISVWEGPEGGPTLLSQVGEPICLADSGQDDGLVWEKVSRQIRLTAAPTVLENLAVAVPLVAEGKVLGALGVAWRNGRLYTADDIELLAAMANQIAVAMDNARLYRDELRMQEALRQYAGQVTRAAEEERKRIARELHDDAIQGLVLLCRQLDLVLESGRPGKGSLKQLTELRGLAESSLQAIRRFSRDLRPSVLDDLGLIPAIEWLASDLSKRTGVAASLEVNGPIKRLASEAELLLFRIVQEALRNAEKHSGASKVRIAVTFADSQVSLTVADDGRGFRLGPIKDGTYSGKLGLLGMQERAHLLGASLEIHSQPGKGTQIKVVAPA